jgi:NAD(P)-dependent dehydrogenase (short-subunit alcohol dehydrogenase family)
MRPNFPENLFSIKDKVIFLTGASGQLGLVFLNAFLSLGAKVIAVDLNIEQLQILAKSRGWGDDKLLIEKLDIRNLSDIRAVFDKARGVFGSVDSLIANAGVSVFEPYLDRPEQSLDYVMDVNLKGTIFCINEFIKVNKKYSANKSIVSIASMYGIVSPDPRIYTDCDRKNSEIYGATKAGVIQLTKYYAVHAAEFGIRVNSISPGGILNSANPQGIDFQANYANRCPQQRMAEASEIVGGVIFLMSDAASYISGQNLVIDGGVTAW